VRDERGDALRAQPGHHDLRGLAGVALALLGGSDHPPYLGGRAVLASRSVGDRRLHRPDGAPVLTPARHPVEPELRASERATNDLAAVPLLQLGQRRRPGPM